MCTVTWWRQPSFYELFFNRDELKSRKPGLPPKVEQLDAVHYVAPADGDYGGTWIWVNEHRLTVCLLNYYPAHPCGSERKISHASRGHLLRSLASCPCMEALKERLLGMSMTVYKPFFLVALLPDQPALQWTWSGHNLSCRKIEDGDLPLTTSSFRTEEIIEERVKEYHRGLPPGVAPSKKSLESYHYADSSKRSATSVCMEREDAQTVSLSRITVNEAKINFAYQARLSTGEDFLPEPVETILIFDQISRGRSPSLSNCD